MCGDLNWKNLKRGWDLSKIEAEIKSNCKDELNRQFNWFCQNLLPAIQQSCDEFFSDIFQVKLISIGKNINILFQGDEYFVTKIKLDKQNDIFFRCSSDAIKIILDSVLGENPNFEITKITQLEAKIISSFSDSLYTGISQFLEKPSLREHRKINDVLHITFFIKEKNKSQSAKIILSIPSSVIKPAEVVSQYNKFDETNFKNSKVEVDIKLGTTKFYLREVKSLEAGDMVIFEDSEIHSMKLLYKNNEIDFKVTPNPGLITTISNDGGHNMNEHTLSQDLWDNIQVEMGAEFEKVKITLGELKNIEQGLVLDISSVYDNKISLRVENKVIARGELVIVNDRYGVRIDEVIASEKSAATAIEPSQEEEMHIQEEFMETSEEEDIDNAEFDYSDFDLDEQDI